MSNELNQDGLGNIGVQGISGPTVNITQILGKSIEYQDLIDQLNTQQKLFLLTPEEETVERLAISKKINELKNQIEQFKQDVLRLAEQFNNVEINTERLKNAKEFFDKGEIGEARAILESDIEQMEDEYNHLIKAREKFEKDIIPKLINNSDEFYILAFSKQTDYGDSDWFQNTCDYFEKSINAYATKDNVFQYALFLQIHNQFTKAEDYYQKYLTDFSNDIDSTERAITLNNLANLHSAKNELEKALEEYEEALEIYREIAKENPSEYLPYVAGTLNNLGLLHSDKNELESTLKEYKEALVIKRCLAEENPSEYLPYVASTLNNLGLLQTNQHDYSNALAAYKEALDIYQTLARNDPTIHLSNVARILNNLGNLQYETNEEVDSQKTYEEALKMRRELAQNNPLRHLPKVAGILNNLGNVHAFRNENSNALKRYEETLKIRRALAAESPEIYSIEVAQSCYNLALFYNERVGNKEIAVKMMIEVIKILHPVAESIPNTQLYLQSAFEFLKDCGLSSEDLEQLTDKTD